MRKRRHYRNCRYKVCTKNKEKLVSRLDQQLFNKSRYDRLSCTLERNRLWLELITKVRKRYKIQQKKLISQHNPITIFFPPDDPQRTVSQCQAVGTGGVYMSAGDEQGENGQDAPT